MVAVYVRDWSSALDWYQDKLGFSTVYVEDDDRFAVLALPEGGPHLHLVGDDTRDLGTRNRCAPNVAVDDFDGASRGAAAYAGVSVIDVVDDPDDGYRFGRA